MTDPRACYNCGPGLPLYRWLCPRCRALYTFTDGRMVARKPGQPSVFELKTAQTLVQFVTGGEAVTLYAIDPGTEKSAIVQMGRSGQVTGLYLDNGDLLAQLRNLARTQGDHLVIEKIESFGMAVGKSVFETCFWSGRFVDAFERLKIGATWSGIGRRDVKLALCGSARAKDANIRQALIDRYGGPSAIKKGGPLYGIKSHLWAALAVGVAYQDIERGKHGDGIGRFAYPAGR